MTESRQRLDAVVKAYDVRGIVPDALAPDLVEAIGAAFARVVVHERPTPARVVVARDMRETGPELVSAFAQGLLREGIDVVDAGMCSTDELYFASGTLDAAGAMFTASHNPAGWNGIKLCRPGAKPVGHETGLAVIKDEAARILDDPAHASGAEGPGTQSALDVLPAYAAHLRSLVDLSSIRPLRVVVDAGSGMAGLTVPAVLGTQAGLDALPLEVLPMYFDLDGTFPHHEANPLDPRNTVDLQREVVRAGADLGLAFDGDADRCFVIDERGNRVNPSALTALVGLREGVRAQSDGPAATVLYNAITSMAVPQLLGDAGIRTVRTRVGHSFIKAVMAQENAVFGGEHSGHFYFRDFFGADSGMLAAMHVLAALGAQSAPLSELVADLDPYTSSGEINVRVDDIAAAQSAVLDRLKVMWPDGGEIDNLDGVTLFHWVQPERWWVNLRPSNTEPLLRVNVEAEHSAVMERVRDEVLATLAKVSHVSA